MSLFDGIRRAFRAPAERRQDVEREVDEELAFHLAMREERLRAKGAHPGDAAAEARRRFGNIDSIRTECVETGGARLRADRFAQHIDDLRRDVRVAIRSLRRSPGFALSVVTLLALGIGGTTAVFSVVNAIYFRPLPFPAAERLALVTAKLPDPRCERRCVRPPSFAEVAEWSGHAKSIEGIGTLAVTQGVVELRSGTLVLEGAAISRSMVDLLGLRVSIGRGLLADDFAPDAARAMVLGQSAWQSQFGGDTAIVGQLATMNGASYRIVGVLAPESELGPPVFSSNVRTPEYLVAQAGEGGGWPSQVVVRHRADVAPSVVQTELAASLANGADAKWTVSVERLRDALSARYRGSFRLLLGAAALVLIITCLNVGGLVIARLNDRMPELATRTVLGAGRIQLVQQVATEIALLAFTGTAGGLLIAFYGIRATRLIPVDRLPFWTPVVMDARVVAAALALTIVGCIGLSLAPIAILSPSRIIRGLRDLVAAAPSRAKMRGVIVSVEIALSVVLVATAGILVRQLVAAERKELGMAKRSVVFLSLSNRQSAGSAAEWPARAITGLRTVPGVASVAVRGMPERSRAALAARREELLRRGPAVVRRVAVFVDGRDDPVPDLVFPIPTIVTTDYFDAVGMPVVAGRVFNPTDNASAPAVGIINAAAAKTAFGSGPAIGRRIKIEAGGTTTEWITIVGVTADQTSPLARTSSDRTELFRPWGQLAAVPSSIAVRVNGESAAMTAAIRDAFHTIDPSMPLESVASIESWIDKQLWSVRFTTDIISTFAMLALLLACLGVYAMMSYVVGRRRRELAIRVAVGATRERVVFTVIRSSARMIVLGLAVGVIGSVAVSRVLRSTVYFEDGLDPSVLGVVAIGVLGAAFVSAFLPARRAARVDPAQVLRAD